MVALRRLHLIIGFTLAPFLLLQAITGFFLRRGNYAPLRWHSWQVVSHYVAYVLAVGLVFLAVSGAVLYINMRVQQWRRRMKAGQAAARKQD